MKIEASCSVSLSRQKKGKMGGRMWPGSNMHLDLFAINCWPRPLIATPTALFTPLWFCSHCTGIHSECHPLSPERERGENPQPKNKERDQGPVYTTTLWKTKQQFCFGCTSTWERHLRFQKNPIIWKQVQVFHLKKPQSPSPCKWEKNATFWKRAWEGKSVYASFSSTQNHTPNN